VLLSQLERVWSLNNDFRYRCSSTTKNTITSLWSDDYIGLETFISPLQFLGP
jgi:hypothetical protein